MKKTILCLILSAFVIETANAKVTYFSPEDALAQVLSDGDFKKETVKIPTGLSLVGIDVAQTGAAPKQEYSFEFQYAANLLPGQMSAPIRCSIAATAVSKVKRVAGITSSSLKVTAIESNCAH